MDFSTKMNMTEGISCILWILQDNLISRYVVELNQYETAPYFFQLSQNLTSDCLLI